MTWSSCAYKTYLTRLAGFEYIRSAPSMAACIGNAFDAFIKDYIAKKRDEVTPLTDVSYLINKNIPEPQRDEAVKMGRKICSIYIKLGLADELLQPATDIQLERELFTIHENIPILGQLDCIINKTIPLDWKTRGFAGKTKAYATGGWDKRIDYDLKKGQVIKKITFPDDQGFHHLEKSRISWAIQQMFYTSLLKQRIEPKYIIHEIARHGDVISFAVHNTQLSVEFYKKHWPNVRKMWDALTDDMYSAEIPKPEPNVRRCMAYGTLCEAAYRCKYYENTLGHPDKERSGEHWQ